MKRGSPATASSIAAMLSGLEQSSEITQTQFRWVCPRIESSRRRRRCGGGLKVAMHTATNGSASRLRWLGPERRIGRFDGDPAELGLDLVAVFELSS